VGGDTFRGKRQATPPPYIFFYEQKAVEKTMGKKRSLPKTKHRKKEKERRGKVTEWRKAATTAY